MVNLVLMDQEFDKIVDRMGVAIVNTCATNEHVTEAERNVRAIKFRRIRVHTLPKQVIIHMVYLAVFWMNVPPATGPFQSYAAFFGQNRH